MLELTGQVGLRHQKAFVRENGMGHMRTAVPKRHWRPAPAGSVYAVDNGKFGADTASPPREWPEQEFLDVLGRLSPDHPPLFVVCPDIVAGGDDSLHFSQEWRQRVEALGFGWMPWALAVQDGMTSALVTRELDTGRWSHVFVGGTKAYKRACLAAWVRIAHRRGLLCHVGGIGRPEDLAWARACGVDSCDYTGWARNDRFEFVAAGRQQQLLVAPGGGLAGEIPNLSQREVDKPEVPG